MDIRELYPEPTAISAERPGQAPAGLTPYAIQTDIPETWIIPGERGITIRWGINVVPDDVDPPEWHTRMLERVLPHRKGA